jgi:nitroreductase
MGASQRPGHLLGTLDADLIPEVMVKGKIAETQYPVHELISRRWSPRAFADRLVPESDLRRVLEAARWAPSSSNEQPWSFLVATKAYPEDYQKLFSCLVPGNQLWVGQAPVLMLSVANLVFEEDGSPNRHAMHDVGLAVENLILQATALGLFVHQMAGFDVDKVRELFKIPAHHEPAAMIALGYLGDPETLPGKLRLRELEPRTRKTLTEFVFTGRWGGPSPVVMEGPL